MKYGIVVLCKILICPQYMKIIEEKCWFFTVTKQTMLQALLVTDHKIQRHNKYSQEVEYQAVHRHQTEKKYPYNYLSGISL